MQLVDTHEFATLMLPITIETWSVDDSVMVPATIHHLVRVLCWHEGCSMCSEPVLHSVSLHGI